MVIIGIDGNEANIWKRVGVGRYAYEVLWQIYKIQNSKFKIQNDNVKFKIYLKDKPLADLPKETECWEYKMVGPKKLWTQFGLPLRLWRERVTGKAPDVFFTPSHYAPRFCPCPRVISIMDLSYLHFPQMFRRQDLYQLKNWTAYSVRKAAKILTISKASKDDIIKYYKIPEEKIVVAYPGFNLQFKMQSSKFKMKIQNEKLFKRYEINSDYILSVSTIQPRKNYPRLIEAFSRLILDSQYKDLALVIVGKRGWMWEETIEAPKKFRVEDKVKFLDYVPDEDLPALYRGAKCFVLVSLYEGFGIPALEAMSFGCPVVVSNISSLPEVVGGGGVLVDPYDIEDIKEGIKKAIKNKDKLVKKGYKQASRFSWEKTAKKVLAVLEEVGGKNV
jgi:glycosyltransferase involved in cell wall biosynthesis